MSHNHQLTVLRPKSFSTTYEDTPKKFNGNFKSVSLKTETNLGKTYNDNEFWTKKLCS